MELRFLEGNFEHGKFKLQYRMGFKNSTEQWQDVPCVKEEKRSCKCGACVQDENGWWEWSERKTVHSSAYKFCPSCGEELKP